MDDEDSSIPVNSPTVIVNTLVTEESPSMKPEKPRFSQLTNRQPLLLSKGSIGFGGGDLVPNTIKPQTAPTKNEVV